MDTFVVAQLRPELRLGDRPAVMYHLRSVGGRREIDLVIVRQLGERIWAVPICGLWA